MRNRILGAAALACLCVGICGASASAQVIDFETKPDGVAPIDNEALPLGTPYTIPFGMGTLDVTIGFDVDGDGVPETAAVFEAVGSDDITGFTGVGPDGPSALFADQLGLFFLRSLSALNDSSPVGVLVAEYSAPVPGLSGEIWDIDGPEQWEVRAFRAGETTPTAVQISPEGGLGSEPWVFSLADPGPGFSRLEIEHIGTRPNSQLGLAFNNFRASESVPGPELLVSTPASEQCNIEGVGEVTLYFTEPVVIGDDDVSVVTGDAAALPVRTQVINSGSNIVTVRFRSVPGGNQQVGAVPLIDNDYVVTIADRARALSNNVPIDGDQDGIAGGDAVLTVSHRLRVDFDGNRVIDFFDVLEFLAQFDAASD